VEKERERHDERVRAIEMKCFDSSVAMENQNFSLFGKEKFSFKNKHNQMQ
jgi:hypothetical protein